MLADFVVRDESLFSGVLAGGAGSLGGGAHAGLGLVHESEATSVSPQAHDQLVGGQTQLHEVVDGPVHVERTIVTCGVFLYTKVEKICLNNNGQTFIQTFI